MRRFFHEPVCGKLHEEVAAILEQIKKEQNMNKLLLTLLFLIPLNASFPIEKQFSRHCRSARKDTLDKREYHAKMAFEILRANKNLIPTEHDLRNFEECLKKGKRWTLGMSGVHFLVNYYCLAVEILKRLEENGIKINP